MARKKMAAGKVDRSDPKSNKSLAIRTVLKQMPSAKASEIVAAVKKEFGHDVSQNMVYMVKTKTNMKASRKGKKLNKQNGDSPINSAALWVDAIAKARELLKATGSVANATALLRALDK